MAYSVQVKNILRQFNKKIPFLQPVYETIVNSLEANADKIEVELFEEDNPLLIEEIPISKKIIEFKITDNGDGFNDENLKSFKEYLSDTKIALGCKGIGRFTWLKVFEDIKIESCINNKLIKFDFNKNTSLDDIKVEEGFKLGTKKTTIYFSDIATSFIKYSKKGVLIHDKREEANLAEIKQKIEDYLLPKLFLLKEEKQRTFQISIKLNNNTLIIDDKSIIKLEKDSFTLSRENTLLPESYTFNLYYNFLSRNNHKHLLMYCANERTVIPFKNIDLGVLPDNSNAIMLLTSKYFDERINDERNEFEFDFSENNPDDDNPITGKKINDYLKQIINKIMETKYPTIQEINKETKEKCIEEYPYLAKYIKPLETSIVESKKELIEKASKIYEEDKRKVKNDFTKMLEKKKPASKEEFLKHVEKVNDISARELAQYILYREQIIDALLKIHNENNSCESTLHNLFMDMGKLSISDSDKNSIYDSNLWLLDDKFLAYFATFSDIQIKAVKEKVLKEYKEDEDDSKKPDLTLFYSDVGNQYIDLIVVEFKAIGAKPLAKMTAVPEIERNIGAIASSFDNIRNIYAYVITNINDEFARSLKRSGLSKLYSTGNTPIFYKYNNGIEDSNQRNIDTHVYILSSDSICKDAQARNKVFLDIIKNK